eukprot:TRINITY_DN82118_c0_g1_i1.p1 TRINITY_DN82118_c0_g1~~TRINITY_DN82118_c0_g1_i1.p1  ORF type:complete len:204 (+),score=63.25 TRINITY_DN82118_c0_g1_i1:97-708(+)
MSASESSPAAGKSILESDLLMWKQPAKTSVALFSFNLLFVLVTCVEFSLTPMFCNLGILGIVGGGVVVKFAAPQLAEHKPKEMISADIFTSLVNFLAKMLNEAILKASDLVFWKNDKATMQALVALLVVRQVAPYISPLFVIWLAGNILLTVPYFLEAKKEDIDKHIGPHIKRAKSFKDDMMQKVPRYSDVMPADYVESNKAD